MTGADGGHPGARPGEHSHSVHCGDCKQGAGGRPCPGPSWGKARPGSEPGKGQVQVFCWTETAGQGGSWSPDTGRGGTEGKACPPATGREMSLSGPRRASGELLFRRLGRAAAAAASWGGGHAPWSQGRSFSSDTPCGLGPPRPGV